MAAPNVLKIKDNRSLGLSNDAPVTRIYALITILVPDNRKIPVCRLILDLHYLLLTLEFLFGWNFTFVLFLSPISIPNQKEDSSPIILPYQTQKQKISRRYNGLWERSVTPKKYLFLYPFLFKPGEKKLHREVNLRHWFKRQTVQWTG